MKQFSESVFNDALQKYQLEYFLSIMHFECYVRRYYNIIWIFSQILFLSIILNIKVTTIKWTRFHKYPIPR